MGISLTGLASGIDWQSILEQLREAEKSRVNLLNNQKSTLEDRLTAWQDLAKKLTDLQNAADDLRDPWDVKTYAASLTSLNGTTNPDSVLSVTTDTKATPGVYQVQVLQVATPQKEYSESFTTSDQNAGETGQLVINGTEITLDGKSLEQIRDEINQLDLGVNANILKVSDNDYRLVLTAEDTGSSGFTFDTSASTMTFTEQLGIDAQISIDGITITRPSNTITDALDGVTFNIYASDPATTFTLKIDYDKEALQDKVQTFVNSYNAVLDEIDKHLAKNDPKAEAGPLASDFTIQSIKANIQNVYLGANMFDMGITIDESNRLEFNTSKFQETLSNDFEGTIERTTTFASNMYRQLYQLTDPIDGTLALKENSLENNIENMEERIAREEERIDRYIDTMTKQFIRMEEALFEMQSQSSWLSQLPGLLGTSSPE